MISRCNQLLALVSCFAAVAICPQAAPGQAANDLGAWTGIMLSPAGALTSVAHNASAVAEGTTEWALRYGRWRYDADDAVHDNLGITWTYGIARFRTSLSVTAAYGLVECHSCSAWTMGGLDFQSVVWRRAFVVDSNRSLTLGAGVKGSIGIGQSRGQGNPSSFAAVAGLPLEAAVPVGGRSSVIASVTPGIGYGRTVGSGFVEGGALPMIGISLDWRVTPSVGVSVGLQRVLLAGAPGMAGAAVSWSPSARAGVVP